MVIKKINEKVNFKGKRVCDQERKEYDLLLN